MALIDDIKGLMHKKEKIRNIGVVAHIDHGKCISGSNRLILADGSVITAKELFEKSSKIGSKFKKTENELIYDIYNNKIEVFSLNKETGEIEKKPVELAWKLTGGELIKIILRNNFEMSTTPEHKYIVLGNNDFIEKEARDIRLGDRIVCSRKLDTISTLDIKKEILYKLSNKPFYATLKEDFAELLKEKILECGIDKIIEIIATDLKNKSFYHGSWRKRYRLIDLLKLAELFKLDTTYVYDNIDMIVYRTGRWRGKNSNKIKLPNTFEDFFYIAGLFIGDGSGNKFVVGKEELGKKFVEICNKWDIDPLLRSYEGKTKELCTNRTFVEILNSLFDYPIGKKSHNVKISEFVFKSPKKYVLGLLRGYFDTDGCVEKSRRAITLTSASNQMIDDLCLLLLRFGCIAIKEKDNTITISGNSAIQFSKEIGFNLKEKLEKTRVLVNNINGGIVCDMVSVGNQIMLMKNAIKNKLTTGDLAYIEVKKIEQTEEEFVYDFTISDNYNFVAEGIIIHNTTFSDNLLAGAGMISEELAGKQLALDFHEDEQERGITIDAANVSMVHTLDGEKYLINLIDTPGHVDFSGDVTRAMRAVDGAIVLIDAVEGIMPQTETVLKQALRERVRPVLFINKVDRLIKEVKLTPEKMQERFIKIIDDVNKFIDSITPLEFKGRWNVSVQDGSVSFGSAFHKWALSFDYMKKKNLTFKDIIESYEQDKYKELSKKAPLHEIVLGMVVKHLPNPVEAQKYRIPNIWRGDLDSEEGKALFNCDEKGQVGFICTKIVMDKHAGEVAAGRLFSGTVKLGQEVYMNLAKRKIRLQQVSVYKGAQRLQVDEVPCGNIVGLVGLKGIFAGETVSETEIEPFEAIKHIFEPVVTKSIEAKKSADLPKLIEVLKHVAKEDPTVVIEINEETGENLIKGMGELHLEVIENRIVREKGVDVITSKPIVVYRENILRKSIEVEGKSPNKHNKFYFIVEPLGDEIYDAIKKGEISEGRIKKKDKSIVEKLRELGADAKEASSYRDIFKGNVLIDNTRGIVHIGEVIEMVMDGFEDVMKAGPLAREPGVKVKVRLMDCKLHEDAIHRGPAQVLPAIRDSIREAMVDGGAVIFEPYQIIQIEAPVEFLGDISKLVQNKRGQLLDMLQEGSHITVKAKLPVAEMFGLTSDLRSATSGRGSHYLVDQGYEKLPESLQEKVIRQIRERKGLSNE